MVACVIASACSVLGPIPDRSRFFTLTASPPMDADRAEASGGAIVYGLGPVVLPAYLDRNQVATRVSETEAAYSQWDRWAEPLARPCPRCCARASVVSSGGTTSVTRW